MALAKTARGVKLVLKVGDGAAPEVFTAMCTINAQRSLTGTATMNNVNIPDCEDPDLLAWVVGTKQSLQYTVDGAGTINTTDVQDIADWLASPDPKNCQIVMDVPSASGGVIFEGAFDLTKWSITGDVGSLLQGSISLASNGAVTTTANT